MIAQTEIVNSARINTVLFSDADNGDFIFMSAVDKTALIKRAASALKKRAELSYRRGRRATAQSGSVDFYISKSPDSDYSNLIAWRKDDKAGYYKKFYIYTQLEKGEVNGVMDSANDVQRTLQYSQDTTNAKAFYHNLYEKLVSGVSVPILEKWVPWICSNIMDSHSFEYYRVYNAFDGKSGGVNLCICSVEFSEEWISDLISNGLANGDINIQEGAVISDNMRTITGLNDYLNCFSETLTNKIQKSFIPKYDPSKDKISDRLMDVKDYAYWKSGFKINLFPSQRVVIQAMCKHLDTNRTGILIGEQGVGKTAMGAALIIAHTKKINTFSVIMCPAHLVRKWKSEIERTMPMSEAFIISKLSELIALQPHIRDKNRKKHLFLIMSKEIAKMDSDTRPAAIWSESKKNFVCPECGKTIYFTNTSGRYTEKKRKEEAFRRKYPELLFMTANSDNQKCQNTVKRFTTDQTFHCCETELWATSNRNNMCEWVKTKSGWILERHLQPLRDRLFNDLDNLDKKESKLLADIDTAIEEIREKKFIVRAPRSYPIAKYIRNHFKDCLDYVLLDECHLYKSKDSAQGLAAGDLIHTAKHSILLTGTLLNGYASGIFHLFFRAFPNVMIKEGYGFDDQVKFQDDFGVVKESRSSRVGTSRESVSKKELPGISPIVFTKFMLENSLFIGMDDISEGLPDYKEIPVGVEMDSDLRESYDEFEEAMRQNSVSGRSMARKVAIQFAQGLIIYSDQPYGQPPIINYETDETVYTPRELSKEAPRRKEEALLDIVFRKRALGEKVLIYYCWTGRTELDKRFISMFSQENIKAVVLDNSVKAEDRQDWIEKQIRDENIDALIVNPKKVETGLDLLDFTTIIFYQTGNDPYTLRQASRRSWRLSQVNDVEVYFMFYQNTVQETLLNMMATKIQASMAIEGKFSEEGLNAMSQNEDFLTQIANSVVQGITNKLDIEVFQKISTTKKNKLSITRELSVYRNPTYPNGFNVENIDLTAISSAKHRKHNMLNVANII